MFSTEYKYECDKLSNIVIGCAIEVHKYLGPGLLESCYEKCLCYELSKHNLEYKNQLYLPVHYKEIIIEPGYRLDVLIENKVIVDLKSVESISPIFKAQMKTYLKLTNVWLGLILNFNVEVMKNGIERIVCG
ncbi:MAG: GxxExxY protein [Ignavibacteriae bacterium]|nr:MAG: GxxExxY protein [Ignavibacteriota bacterium]